jgi:hypothetical protein
MHKGLFALLPLFPFATKRIESQPQMLELLSRYEPRIKTMRLNKSNISQYETGRLDPPIPVLAAYAEVVNMCPMILMKAKLKLPEKLPVVPCHRAED